MRRKAVGGFPPRIHRACTEVGEGIGVCWWIIAALIFEW